MLVTIGDRLSSRGRRLRWGILGVSGLPVVGACLYNQGFHVPLLACPLKLATGIPCPTCGMTRSFLAFVQGDLAESATYHLFGPLLFIGFVVAVVHSLGELVTRRGLSVFYVRWLGDRRWQSVFIAFLFCYYGLRLAVRFSLIDQGETWFSQSWVQILVAAAKEL